MTRSMKHVVVLFVLGMVAGPTWAAPLHRYLFDDAYVDANGDRRTSDMYGRIDAVLRSGADVADGILILGAGGYLELPSVTLADRFILEFVLRIPTGTTRIQTIAATAGATADAPGLKVMVNRFSGAAPGVVAFESGDGTAYSGRQVFSAAGTFEFDEAWHRIRVEVDRSHPAAQVWTYYDGLLVARGAAADFPLGPTELRIGQMLDGAWPLRGEIAEVAIIPEPATLALITLGGGICLLRRCRRARHGH